MILDTNIKIIKSNIKLIITKIKELRLKVKGNIKINNLNTGLDFLGFVFKRRCILLRRSISSAFKAATLNFINKPSARSLISVISYNGWIIASNSYNLWKKHINYEFKNIIVNIDANNKVLWR